MICARCGKSYEHSGSHDVYCPDCRPKFEPAPEPKPLPLKEGEDFYYNENGLMVFTAAYLLRRGYCCDTGCLNCPWG